MVTTLRVVWIEIFFSDIAQLYPSVTTLRVVWIEIPVMPYVRVCI